MNCIGFAYATFNFCLINKTINVILKFNFVNYIFNKSFQVTKSITSKSTRVI